MNAAITTVTPFSLIYQRVLDRFGNASVLEESLPVPASANSLLAVSDAEYLSLMSRRVFRAGLKHALVDAKWPAFEEAFYHFQPDRLAAFSDEELEQAMANRALIRHFGKIKSIRQNAVMVVDIIRENSSFGRWLAEWPVAEIVGLWLYLKEQGSQLGGQSGLYFLRMAGKDTFILTDDVVAALSALGLLEKRPTSQKDLFYVQGLFNSWQEETGRPQCQLSRLLSMTVN